MLDLKYCMYGDDSFDLKICDRILRTLSKMGCCDLYLMPSLGIVAVLTGWAAPRENGKVGALLGTFDDTVQPGTLHEELSFAIEEACPSSVEFVEPAPRVRATRAVSLDFDDADEDADCVAELDALRILSYGCATPASRVEFDFN